MSDDQGLCTRGAGRTLVEVLRCLMVGKLPRCRETDEADHERAGERHAAALRIGVILRQEAKRVLKTNDMAWSGRTAVRRMNRRPVPLSSMLHKGVAHGTPLVRPHSARRSPARACRTSARGSPAVEAGQATSEAARGAAGRRGEFTRNVRCPLEVPPLVLRRRRRLRRPGEVTLRRRRQNNRYAR